MKCIYCGKELLSGDSHFESGLCNKCWDKNFYREDKPYILPEQLYADLYLDLLKKYRELEEGNKNKQKELVNVEKFCDTIKERLKVHCEYTDEENIGWYLPERKIDTLIDKIKEEILK